MFQSTKTYTHSLGISAAFRQHRAKSHCRFIHGYALEFKFIFESEVLDENGWVVDFGALKPLKESLVTRFDHKLLVAADDPEFHTFVHLHSIGVADIVICPDGVGCEKFAKQAFKLAEEFLRDSKLAPRVRIVSAEVKEHGANSAVYLGEQDGR